MRCERQCEIIWDNARVVKIWWVRHCQLCTVELVGGVTEKAGPLSPGQQAAVWWLVLILGLAGTPSLTISHHSRTWSLEQGGAGGTWAWNLLSLLLLSLLSHCLGVSWRWRELREAGWGDGAGHAVSSPASCSETGGLTGQSSQSPCNALTALTAVSGAGGKAGDVGHQQASRLWGNTNNCQPLSVSYSPSIQWADGGMGRE